MHEMFHEGDDDVHGDGVAQCEPQLSPRQRALRKLKTFSEAVQVCNLARTEVSQLERTRRRLGQHTMSTRDGIRRAAMCGDEFLGCEDRTSVHCLAVPRREALTPRGGR